MLGILIETIQQWMQCWALRILLATMKHFIQLSSKGCFGYEVIQQKYHTSHPKLWCFVPADVFETGWYYFQFLSRWLNSSLISTLQLSALYWLTRLQLHMWPPQFLHKRFQDITFDLHVCDWHMWFIHVCVLNMCFLKMSMKTLYRESFLRVVWRWRAVQDMFCFGFDEVQGFNCDQGKIIK